MDSLPTLLSIAVIWGIAAVTPGPNFFVILRTTAVHARPAALAAVAGVCSGTLLWGLAGFFGISTLFALAPWFYVALKVVGGLYLTYLGLRLIANSFRARPPSPVAKGAAQGAAPPNRWSAWRLGLLTNLANPKTAAFVTSLFATTMPAEPTFALGLAAALVMTGVSLLWYGGVALVFGSAPMTAFYAGAAKAIDRLAGGIFVFFGAKLALDR